MNVVGTTNSILSGERARVYRFKPLERVHVLRAFPQGKAAIVSFFAKSVGNSERLRVSVEGPYSSQTKDFQVTATWTRFEIAISNELSVKPLNAYFTCMTATKNFSDLAIALTQCEPHLFASSPIPPDIALPAFAHEGAQGARREADRLWFDKEKTGFGIDSNAATFIFLGGFLQETNQILDEFFTMFAFWSRADETEYSVGISGKHGARFVLRERRYSEENFTPSDIIASKQTYFVCAVFDRNTLTIIVNGMIAISKELDQFIGFNRLYIGCSHYSNNDGFFGHVKRTTLFHAPLLYPRILEIFGELCPERFNYTYAYMMQYFRYSLTSDNEISTFNACMKDEGFSYFVRQLRFAIPEIYTQFPPGKHFLEEDVRDWVHALMKRPETISERESYSKIGKTDLLLRYIAHNQDNQGEHIDRVYRMEFKIWGRKGYREAPTQPLKYMSESELTGAFVMIDRRIKPEIADFENIILNNKEYRCLSIKEIPVIEADIRYFISFHSDSRYRVPRMMINIYLPIP